MPIKIKTEDIDPNGYKEYIEAESFHIHKAIATVMMKFAGNASEMGADKAGMILLDEMIEPTVRSLALHKVIKNTNDGDDFSTALHKAVDDANQLEESARIAEEGDNNEH
jgi:hypothetical protein